MMDIINCNCLCRWMRLAKSKYSFFWMYKLRLVLNTSLEHPIYSRSDRGLVSDSNTLFALDRSWRKPILWNLQEPLFLIQLIIIIIISSISIQNLHKQNRNIDNYGPTGKGIITSTSHKRSEYALHSSTIQNKILLVDDEPDLADLFKMVLQKAGYEVDTYYEPSKALTNYRAGKYNLLLFDVRMPTMSGFDLYQKIKDIDAGATNICFITAFEEYQKEFKEKFPGLEEDDCFIKKPIALVDFVRLVKSKLK
jgi:CheY-like chemotaxis protein